MSYRTRATFLGLPLIHIATGKIVDGHYERETARGWIAIGDISFGVVLAIGGIAVGGVALGGIALGCLAFAGMAVGFFAIGGMAAGIMALGGMAVAFHSAIGGMALAKKFALGGLALAAHGNDQAAQEYFRSFNAASIGKLIIQFAHWFAVMILLPLVYAMGKKGKRNPKENI